MQSYLKHVEYDTLVSPMSQHIVKKKIRYPVRDTKTGYIMTDIKGNIIYERKGGTKIGVMVAGVDPAHPDYVVVGYVLVHDNDKFDYIRTPEGHVKQKGFGRDIASKRAVKWAGRTLFDRGEDTCPKLNNAIVRIPDSILEDLRGFAYRVCQYYKDKTVPVWLEHLILSADEK